MRWMQRVLFKQKRLESASEAVDAQIRIVRSLQNKLHVIGSATVKAWWPYVSIWSLGMMSRWRLVEQRYCRSATWATGMHRHPTPGHADTCTLYVIKSATSSQCNSAYSRCVRTQSYFLVSLITRAAAFMTRRNLSVTVLGAPANSKLSVTKECTSVAADSSSCERRTRRRSWRN